MTRACCRFSLALALALCPAACDKAEPTNRGMDQAAPAATPVGADKKAEAEATPVAEEPTEELEEDADGEARLEMAKPSKEKPPESKPGKKDVAEQKAKDRRTGGDADDLMDELGSLESKLASLEGEMRAAGVPLPLPEGALAGAASGSDVSSVGPLQCKKACELTKAICGLSDSICALKERHPDDARYVNACTRAQNDCSLGKSSCESCSEK